MPAAPPLPLAGCCCAFICIRARRSHGSRTIAARLAQGMGPGSSVSYSDWASASMAGRLSLVGSLGPIARILLPDGGDALLSLLRAARGDCELALEPLRIRPLLEPVHRAV